MQYANLRLDTPEHNPLELGPPEIKLGWITNYFYQIKMITKISTLWKVTSFLLYQTDLETEVEVEYPEYSR